jgi:tripartite-type tricarboxylate transporter receptor subunit TctC
VIKRQTDVEHVTTASKGSGVAALPGPRRVASTASTGLLLCACLLGCSKDRTRSAEWPRRPIQITCFSSPGGGTDTVDRTIAQAMEPFLGVRVNVVNKRGARGGEAIQDVWSREHDGYRWGGFSETILPAPVLNVQVDVLAKDWTYFMVAGAPGLISVAPQAEYQTLDALVAAAKAHPGQLNAAASNAGGIWHTKLIALEKAAGIKFNFIPYDGSNPSQLALLSGEVQVVLTSVSEQAEMIKADKLRPLAMMSREPYDFPGRGVIPSAAEQYPDIAKIPISQWLGFALPADTPPNVLEKITHAFEQAMQSQEVRAMAESRLLTLHGYHGEQANRMARETEQVWTWLLFDLGIAERSPETLGLARP